MVTTSIIFCLLGIFLVFKSMDWYAKSVEEKRRNESEHPEQKKETVSSESFGTLTFGIILIIIASSSLCKHYFEGRCVYVDDIKNETCVKVLTGNKYDGYITQATDSVNYFIKTDQSLELSKFYVVKGSMFVMLK